MTCPEEGNVIMHGAHGHTRRIEYTYTGRQAVLTYKDRQIQDIREVTTELSQSRRRRRNTGVTLTYRTTGPTIRFQGLIVDYQLRKIGFLIMRSVTHAVMKNRRQPIMRSWKTTPWRRLCKCSSVTLALVLLYHKMQVLQTDTTISYNNMCL